MSLGSWESWEVRMFIYSVIIFALLLIAFDRNHDNC